MERNNYYRIYGKKKTDKRFKVFDYWECSFVDKLIYAPYYTEDRLLELKVIVGGLNCDNPDFIFEIRKV